MLQVNDAELMIEDLETDPLSKECMTKLMYKTANR